MNTFARKSIITLEQLFAVLLVLAALSLVVTTWIGSMEFVAWPDGLAYAIAGLLALASVAAGLAARDFHLRRAFRWRIHAISPLLLLLAHVVAFVAAKSGLTNEHVPPARPVARTSTPGPARPATPPLPPEARRHDTAHFRIVSTASESETRDAGLAVEAVREAYAAVFADADAGRRFEVVLYRNRTEFSAYNRSRPWAEAYYLEPRSHAYPGTGPNRWHWAMHEVVHQLLREQSGLRPKRWLNEGIASWFGASRLADGKLRAGTPDPGAYPIWHLARQRLTGDRQADILSGDFIPLEVLIEERGPAVDAHVNLYYVHWWSLVHFLMQADGGRHAASVVKLAERGGTLADFEAVIGPVETIEPEWYAHLLAQVRAAGGPSSAGG